MIGAVILPALLLGVLGWVVPRALARVLPETLVGLACVGVLSVLALLVLSAGLFAALYGPATARIWAESPFGIIAHFQQLGLKSSLIWAPILTLSVMGLPAGWKESRW